MLMYVTTLILIFVLLFMIYRVAISRHALQLVLFNDHSQLVEQNFIHDIQESPATVIEEQVILDETVVLDSAPIVYSGDVSEVSGQDLSKGFDAINRLFLQHSTSEDINQQVLSQLCKDIKCHHAALYKADEELEELMLISGYGINKKEDKTIISYGDGMIGQAALDNELIIVREVPPGYVKVASGLGESDPTWIAIFPLSFKGKAHGVMELCFLYPESELIKNHLERVAEVFGAHFFNQRVIAKQSQLKQLEQEKLRSEAILEGCADGFIGFNRQGVIDFCNRSAAELIALDKSSILGQSVDTLLNVTIKEEEDGHFMLIHHGAEDRMLSEKTEIQIIDAQNEEITVLVTANTISLADDILFTLFLQKISVDLF
ncbi:MAG: GAF domain-containing protein [Bacteroidota bacterium]